MKILRTATLPAVGLLAAIALTGCSLLSPTTPTEPTPVETTHVQLPTGDRLLIPTGAEALRLKGYLIMCRNSRRDYTEFADMVDAVEPETAAMVLAGMDSYYCHKSAERFPHQQWMASQLVRQLADPNPSDIGDLNETPSSGAGARADWEDVRRRCLSVAVAMLEEAK